MTNKLEISRELAEKCLDGAASMGWSIAEELRALLAAPVIERQEPVGYVSFIGNGFVRVRTTESLALEEPIYTSQPAPVAVPDGWKLVPIEPTELMIRRGDQHYSWSVAKIYKAMISEDVPACIDKAKELNQ